MKNFIVTVNGTSYEVQVEEVAQGQATQTTTVKTAAPKPVATKAAAPAKAVAGGASGSIKINAPMPGKVVDIKVSLGQKVKKGDLVAILEAMKMENEIVAPQDGTVAGINASSGQAVEAGDVILTLN